MERESVSSSLISSVGYDAETETMEIEFRTNGAVYEYRNVPESVYREMKSAGSVGRYFLHSVKDRYRGIRK